MLHNIKKDLHSRKKQATFLRFLVSLYISLKNILSLNKHSELNFPQTFMKSKIFILKHLGINCITCSELILYRC